MNRWFVAALLTLALIVLVSPGIVGRLAEKSVEDSLDFAADETDEIVVTTESFERGWFTSEGRNRIELAEGPIRDLFVDEGSGQIPSLIVETHVDHGLVPLTSLSRDSGSLMPGLASMISTMKLDAGNGEIIELPGKIYSQVGLTGETKSRFLMQAGSRQLGRASLEWQGADITVQSDPSSGSLAFQGQVLPLSMMNEDRRIELGRITIDGLQDRSPFDFNVGTAHIDVDSVTIIGAGNPPTTFGKLVVSANSEIGGDTVNAATTLHMSSVPTAALGDLDIVVDLACAVDARSIHKIVKAVRNAQLSADPHDALAGIYPLIENDVQELLLAGLELRFDRFDVILPSGELTTKIQFSLPPAGPRADFSWPALLLALKASAEIRMPAALYEMAAAMSPDASMLVATGILKKDGEYYEMTAEYAQGLITVNGAPMPIPLQGL